jgi:glucose/arabinose dehydrogenase
MRLIRYFSLALFAVMLTAGSVLTIVAAQDEETEGYTAPVSPYEGVAVAQPGGELGEGIEIQLVKVADGLLDPVNVTNANDGSGRLFIVERFGYIRIMEEDGTILEEPFLDVSDVVITQIHTEQGLLGVAFHPDFASNGLFYVNYAEARTNGDMILVEYQVSADDPNVADPDSARAIFATEQPFNNHNGGTIKFGPDGYLYMSVGDGGMAGDPYNFAQNINNPLGKILRIDVNARDGAGYGIPDDNPFVGQDGYKTDRDYFGSGVVQHPEANQIAQVGSYRPGAVPEIYHFGLRNPWQFDFDPETGDMYLTDVGQVAWEEINFIPAGSRPGLNFGWDFLEGGHCYPPEGTVGDAEEYSPAAPYGTLSGCSVVGVPPVAEYNHELGCSVTGLGVYRGAEFESLDGVYFAADYCTGRVWGLARDDAGAWQFEELLQVGLQPTSSGRGQNGDLYMTAFDPNFDADANDPSETPRGSLWRIVAADQVPEGAETAPPAVAEEEEEDLATPEASPVASPAASPEAED